MQNLQASANAARTNELEFSRRLQREARRVAHENLRLRSLLARFRVTENQLEKWITVDETSAEDEECVWKEITAVSDHGNCKSKPPRLGCDREMDSGNETLGYEYRIIKESEQSLKVHGFLFLFLK